MIERRVKRRIVVKNYIEGARARAIGKNRSVAVVFERLSGRAADLNSDGIITGAVFPAGDLDSSLTPPRFVSSTATSFTAATRTSQPADINFLPYNTCIKLSMSEEPMPVTERTVPAAILITARSPLAPAIPAIPTTYSPPLLDADQTSSLINEVRVFQVSSPASTNAAALLGEYLIAGNEISFGKSPARYTITSPATRESHDNYSSNVDATKIWFSVLNERGLDGLGEMSFQPYVNIQAGETWSEFRIYQKPKTIYTQTVQLPKGTCIDLSLSGFANDRAGLSDYRARFASDWVISGTAGAPRPDELRPVTVVFSPNGSLSRVYANQKASGSVVNPQSVRIDAVEDIFFHIGRIDQVVMPVDPALSVRTRAALVAAEANGIKQNLTDPSSYILRLSAKSGAISAAPINMFVPETGDGLFDIVAKSRLGTYNSTITGQ